MKNKKFLFYTGLVIILLVFSTIYRVKFYKSYSDDKAQLPPELKDKTIIRLWMKKSIISPTRSYQIEKFNNENKDNIHIIFSEYKEDYYNALRTTLASGYGPDIFEYGYTTLIKNNQIADLNSLGLDLKDVDKTSVISYKDMPIGVKLMENNAKLIWNKDLLKKAGLDPNKGPTTWEELIDYSMKIKKAFPEVTPFAFSIKEYEDMKTVIGQPSISKGSIYSTFWDYKKGEYNFNYAKDILNIYNKLYSSSLIDEDFDKKSKNQLRSEFYRGEIAMMISTFEDKGYFSNILPLSFETGIKDIIQVDGENKNKYYYTQNLNFLVVNSESIKDEKKKEGIKKVYEFLLSEEVNREILETRNALPVNLKNKSVKNDIYKEYNETANYHNETYDPTLFLSRNSRQEINVVLEAIKGSRSVDSAIEELNKEYKNYYNFAIEKEDFDFKYYIEK
ncbi:extracellular solute-binding protein [Clostridium sp. MSJ-11]|uniref:Extracellular solute-binding protein n=1 Tax=Clostridium mobile TaxID=2841512 RepID=A0ABS6EJU1_9CLOT|nr:extracellular solute-binding protein [Clostridium mobile]MBU5485493.1 extracellular solute-binding protein [Clostridium mobile]